MKHTSLPLVLAAAFALGACEGAPPPPPPPPVQPPPAPVVEPPPEVSEIKVARVAPRSTLASTLGEMGLGNGDVSAVLEALRPIFDFRKSRIGDQIRTTFKGGRLELVEYRSSPLNEWLVERDGDKLVGRKREIEVEKKVATVDLAIGTSVYESMIAAGEDPGLAVDVADVLAWDVDFYRDVRRGDRLRVVVEKEISQGRTLRYGTILGARYEGELTGSKRFLHYAPLSGDPSYFDENGNAAKRAFLKSPLKYVHITSRFGGRRHPLLGYQQQHQGTDYAAAIGTPVWAVADGTVTRVVHGDRGGGNFVFLRHANGFETGYLHLSRFAEGIRVGARVRQKQVIAYSGNTGMSTGPHLHFAMKRNGGYVNALSQKFPHADPLPKKELPRFKEETAEIAQMLDAEIVAELDPKASPEIGAP